MSSLLCQNLCSEPFPDCYRKFVKRRDGGNKGDAGCAGDSIIELFSGPFIRNIFYPVRKAGRMFNQQFRLWPAWAYESLGKRVCDERAGSDSGAKITFGMKFLEGDIDSEFRDCQHRRKRTRAG